MEIFDIKGATVGRGWSAGFFHKLFYGSFPTALLETEPRSRGVSRAELREKLKDDAAAFRELRSRIEAVPAADSGLCGLAVPREFGGLGLSLTRTVEIIRRLSEKGRSPVILDIYRSFILQQLLLIFGAKKQRATYLPRLAQGEPAAAALTDAEGTTAVLRDYKFNLSGEKTLYYGEEKPKLIAVTAVDAARRGHGVFLLEAAWPGISLAPLETPAAGLRVARLILADVPVPPESLIGEIGQGDHHAQAALDIAQLLLAAGTGPVKDCLRAARLRLEMPTPAGGRAGDDEISANALADIAANLYAMEAVSAFAAGLADRGALAHRQEAAAARLFADDTEQRILELTAHITQSKERTAADAARDAHLRRAGLLEGEPPLAALAREAVERHLRAIGTWAYQDMGRRQRYLLLAGITAFYALWYPLAWLGWSWWPRWRRFGRLARHLRFAEKHGRKLARAAFHGMLLHGRGYRSRRVVHERLARIGILLYAITAAVVHAHNSQDESADGGRMIDLADMFCRGARRRVKALFRELWGNDDVLKRRTAREVLDKRCLWLEHD
ncbi:MAG: acyl-CoA dehydrogenase family protein [Elusimicrobiota bacterium]